MVRYCGCWGFYQCQYLAPCQEWLQCTPSLPCWCWSQHQWGYFHTGRVCCIAVCSFPLILEATLDLTKLSSDVSLCLSFYKRTQRSFLSACPDVQRGSFQHFASTSEMLTNIGAIGGLSTRGGTGAHIGSGFSAVFSEEVFGVISTPDGDLIM